MREIDELANLWEKTKDPKYKALWYQYVKEWADGTNNSERRFISTSSSIQADNGRNSITRSSSIKLF
tara:strand:+ start:253 stop:453 length:201 start_codon:yes stop_codon:yes gene_type:complete